MQTILYQGQPAEGGRWLAIPDACVETYQHLGYGVRELVLRSDAEQSRIAYFNEAIELAAQMAEQACLVPPDGGAPTDEARELGKDAAARIRALRIKVPA